MNQFLLEHLGELSQFIEHLGKLEADAKIKKTENAYVEKYNQIRTTSLSLCRDEASIFPPTVDALSIGHNGELFVFLNQILNLLDPKLGVRLNLMKLLAVSNAISGSIRKFTKRQKKPVPSQIFLENVNNFITFSSDYAGTPKLEINRSYQSVQDQLAEYTKTLDRIRRSKPGGGF